MWPVSPWALPSLRLSPEHLGRGFGRSTWLFAGYGVRVFTELSWLDITSLDTTELLGPLFSAFVRALELLFIHEILHRIRH